MGIIRVGRRGPAKGRHSSKMAATQHRSNWRFVTRGWRFWTQCKKCDNLMYNNPIFATKTDFTLFLHKLILLFDANIGLLYIKMSHFLPQVQKCHRQVTKHQFERCYVDAISPPPFPLLAGTRTISNMDNYQYQYGIGPFQTRTIPDIGCLLIWTSTEPYLKLGEG